MTSRRIGMLLFSYCSRARCNGSKGINMMRAGDWVEIRSKEEILATLDKNAQLDGLPFMPQMFQYCGQRFQVFKRAHKTCDTVSGHYVGRSLPGGIHLNQRCDGKAYGGCQAGCLIFWREAWLKPVYSGPPAGASLSSVETSLHEQPAAQSCSELDVWRATRADDGQHDADPRYACQTTELCNFTA